MAEHVSLQATIDNAIGEYCVQNGGGIPVAYVVVVDMMNSNGDPIMVVTAPADQQTYRSMGLAAYAGAWYTDDAQRLWGSLCDTDSEED